VTHGIELLFLHNITSHDRRKKMGTVLEPIGVVNFIAATTGLGTAAFAVVDASKAFGGGPSNIGFWHIERAVEPFFSDLPGAAIGKTMVLASLKANWLNGDKDKEQQKTVAKSLIKLNLSPESVDQYAEATGIDKILLGKIAEGISTGVALDTDQTHVVERFEAIVSAKLDAGYGRADQLYRNVAKLLASAVAMGLAIIASAYFDIGLPRALMMGLFAAPLAPVSKDLADGLASALRAVK
jgi:hypothetical protein